MRFRYRKIIAFICKLEFTWQIWKAKERKQIILSRKQKLFKIFSIKIFIESARSHKLFWLMIQKSSMGAIVKIYNSKSLTSTKAPGGVGHDLSNTDWGRDFLHFSK